MSQDVFRFQIASDIRRDGLGMELWLGETLVAEVFRRDADNTLTISCWREDIPLVQLEKLVRLARERLGNFENGEALPSPLG